jgi:hypothetical protein
VTGHAGEAELFRAMRDAERLLCATQLRTWPVAMPGLAHIRKNARMTLIGLEQARHALRRHDPSALLGERESVWLDVESGVHPLNTARGAEELAAFANTPDGGLLPVGFSARIEHGEEILDQVEPVPRRLVNLDQHRSVLATRVIPALREVTVDWIDCGDDAGVLVIDIPAQPRSSQLFAVPAPTGKAQISTDALGVPIRRGDGMT